MAFLSNLVPSDIHMSATASKSTVRLWDYRYAIVAGGASIPLSVALFPGNAQYVSTFALMFTAAMVISHLSVRLRSEAEAARLGQMRTEMMHAFNQQLANTSGLDEVLSVGVRQIAQTLSSDVLAFTPGADGGMEPKARSDGAGEIDDKMRGVARWVLDAVQPAGLGTELLPDAGSLYLPLRGAHGPLGVLCVAPRHRKPLDVEQRKLLDSLSGQIGMVLEINRLQKDATKAAMEAEAERLRSSLLSSVSHDLRTPLAAIMGSASALLEGGGSIDTHRTQELLLNIQSEGERLSRLVQNLLQATRLESGKVRLQKELYPLEDVIGNALRRLEKSLKDREVRVSLPDDVQPLRMDGLLVEQVVINLLENAVRHTPTRSPIDISAEMEGTGVKVTVADRGAGLQRDEHERVFEKFYHSPASTGAGLGLAICRAIVSAHGGQIFAANRSGGGAAFFFTLPLEQTHGN